MLIPTANNFFRIITSCALLLLFSACEFGSGTTPETHIENAKKFLAENKPNASIIELKNALKKESNLPEARWLLGKNYLRLRDGFAAFKELNDAQTLGYSDPLMEANLLRALLYQGKYQDIVDKTEAVTVDSNDILVVRGNALLGLKQFVDARSNFNKALAINPESVNAASSAPVAVQGAWWKLLRC